MRRTLCNLAALALPIILTAQTAQSGKIGRNGSREWTEEVTGTFANCPRMTVETTGAVEVRGGAVNVISYRVVKRVRARNEEEARRRLSSVRIEVRKSSDRAELSLETSHDAGADFFITVPKTMLQAHVESAGGNILIENIDGEAVISTAGGDVRADQIRGGAKIETAGGSISIGMVRGTLHAETAGGNITLADGQGEATLETGGGGNIVIENCTRTVRASSAGGDVTIRRGGGDARVETAGGTIHLGVINGIVVAETAGGRIEVESAHAVVRAENAAGPINLGRIAGPDRAETAAGNINATFVADRASWAESMIGTNVGDIVVYIPSNLGMTIQAVIDVAASQQSIRSDFPLVFRNSPAFQIMQQLIGEAQINGGGPPLRIHTGTGKIQIIRVNK